MIKMSMVVGPAAKKRGDNVAGLDKSNLVYTVFGSIIRMWGHALRIERIIQHLMGLSKSRVGQDTSWSPQHRIVECLARNPIRIYASLRIKHNGPASQRHRSPRPPCHTFVMPIL